MNGPAYFQIKDNLETGNLIFENQNGLISSDNLFLDIIYTILGNKNISQTEKVLQEKGFISFPLEDNLKVPIIKCSCDKITINAIYTKDDWLNLLNEYLPELSKPLIK